LCSRILIRVENILIARSAARTAFANGNLRIDADAVVADLQADTRTHVLIAVLKSGTRLSYPRGTCPVLAQPLDKSQTFEAFAISRNYTLTLRFPHVFMPSPPCDRARVMVENVIGEATVEEAQTAIL
jgi:hypothetical protein